MCEDFSLPASQQAAVQKTPVEYFLIYFSSDYFFYVDIVFDPKGCGSQILIKKSRPPKFLIIGLKFGALITSSLGLINLLKKPHKTQGNINIVMPTSFLRISKSIQLTR